MFNIFKKIFESMPKPSENIYQDQPDTKEKIKIYRDLPDLEEIRSHMTLPSELNYRSSGELYDVISDFQSINRIDDYLKPNCKTKVVCILFCQPSHKLAKDEILPNLAYYHYRSGEYTNLYFSGYTQNKGDNKSDYIHVGSLEGKEWYFSPKHFNIMRKDLENNTNWKYSGEVELILTNSVTIENNDKDNIIYENRVKVLFDFSLCILCNLDEMIRIKAIPSIPSFLEKLFQYSENENEKPSPWKFSDRFGLDFSKNAFQRFLLSILPKNLGDEVDRVKHFAVKNISR
jgi:hypothetical protein